MTRRRFAAGIGIATFFGLLAGAAYAVEPVRFLTGPNPGEPLAIAVGYIQANRDALGLTQADLADVVVKDSHKFAHNGVTHLYLRQQLAGVEVWNGDININVARDGSVINLGNRFVRNLAGTVDARSPAIAAEAAVARAAEHLGLTLREPLTLLRNDRFLPTSKEKVGTILHVLIHRKEHDAAPVAVAARVRAEFPVKETIVIGPHTDPALHERAVKAAMGVDTVVVSVFSQRKVYVDNGALGPTDQSLIERLAAVKPRA